MSRFNPRETIEEYDKRIWGNIKYIATFATFVVAQFIIVGLMNLPV